MKNIEQVKVDPNKVIAILTSRLAEMEKQNAILIAEREETNENKQETTNG